MGDAEHGVMDAVAFEATVAKDLPALHACEDVLNASPDLFVFSIVLLLPGGQFFACAAAVRDDQASALIAAVGNCHRVPDGGFGAGLLPASGVMPVTRHGLADDYDPAGIGIDHNLMGRGVSIVLRLLGHRVVAGGHQGAVDDEDGVPAEPAPLPECQQRTEVVNDAVCSRLGDPEPSNSGASWRIVKFVRQHAVTSRTRSSNDRLQGRPRGRSAARSRRTAATNLPKQRGLSPVKGPLQDGTDDVITPVTP